MAAARVLLGLTQIDLAALTNISVPTIKRMEGSDGPIRGKLASISIIRGVLCDAGVSFINPNETDQGILLQVNKKTMTV